MRPKTREFLYFLLWTSETLRRPTWRNLTESFEGWAYRNGFHRQLARLERLSLIESMSSGPDQRIHRLTEAGRQLALSGRDPPVRWDRSWDGLWRIGSFDVPVGQDAQRNRLRRLFRSRGFGYLQNSLWITPDPLIHEREILGNVDVDVESLILLEARPCTGETDEQIVAGAWDFAGINSAYAAHREVLRQRPRALRNDVTAARKLHHWACRERAAWEAAVSHDPLLPRRLLPREYLGCKAWAERCAALARAGAQVQRFQIDPEG